MTDICDKYLTDQEFLTHMVPHHQVAVIMSKKLMKKSKTPYMLEICRNIIRIQEYEIWIMEMILAGKQSPNVSTNSVPVKYLPHENNIPGYVLPCYYQEGVRDKNAKCDPGFFDPQHAHHGGEITDRNFLEHMIPHHQVAVNMSKRLLKHTQSPFMIEFCRRVINSQEEEIWTMKGILKNYMTYNSSIL